MITKVAAGVAGSSLVLLFFYGGIFRNILLPGFYVSSQITLSSDGAGYLAVGLAIDAVLLSYCVYWLLWAPKSIPDLRRQFRPSRLVSLAVLALVIFYLKPLTTFGYVKWQARKSPEMWVMPMPLPEVPPEACVGVRHSYFGYEFKVPWPEVKRERTLESAVILNFSSGAAVSLFDPSQTTGALDAMKQAAGSRAAELRPIFGDTATASNYDLRRATLYLTPKDLSQFSSRQRMVGSSMLLLIKSVETKRLKGGLYSFQTGTLRGFQEGSPEKDAGVRIDAFDAQDRDLELLVGSEKGAKQVSQADIDRILCSLRPISTP